MGQRTQLVLKLKDRFGNVTNKVYHEQWGFGKTMPMLILEFLISMEYGRSQKKYVEVYKYPEIKSLDELKEMSPSEIEDSVRTLQDSAIRHLGLDSFNVSNEYEDANYNGTPLLSWDFDITNIEHVRAFTGDNNDGLALISVEEKFTDDKYGKIEYDITIGFLVSEYQGKLDNDDELDEVAINKWHDITSYCSYYKSYCPKKIINSIKNLYEYFEVNQLGKETKVK